MKILQLCKKFPFPLKDGESIAVTYLSKALHQLGCEITLLAMNTSKHFFDINDLPSDFNHYKSIHVVAVDNRIKPKEAFFNLFSKESYHVARYISEDYNERLVSLLEEIKFDIVQMETVYLAPYIDTIKSHSDAVIVQRSHNVEFEIWERMASNMGEGPKKWYISLLANRLKQFEVSRLNSYDLMLPITGRDKERFGALGCKIPMMATPIGLQTELYDPKGFDPPENWAIGFIGSMDWMPNIEGITWFIENVWPLVLAEFPEMTLFLAGRNTPEWLYKKNYDRVVIKGEIEDALEFMATKSMMIVPLLSGGGMKVKILESLSLGVLTISTSIGLEGIPAKEGEEIMVADSPMEFLKKIKWVVENEKQANDMRKAGRRFAVSHFDNLEVGKRVLEFYKTEKVAV